MLGGSPHRLTIPAELSRVAEVRQWVGRIGESASLPETRVFDLQVATSEAIANGIEHAASQVDLAVWVLPDRLLVEITNDGIFRPGIYKDDAGRRRGLGLPLMASLADQVHVARLPSERTRVSLTFFLDHTAIETPGQVRVTPGRGRRRVIGLLLLPLPILVALVLIFWGMGLSGSNDSQSVLTVFNTLFVSAACAAVAAFAGSSVIRTGSVAVLVLGAGAVVLAVGFLFASGLLTDPNYLVTVHNVSVLAAGALFASSGVLALVPGAPVRAQIRTRVLMLTYLIAAAFVVVIAFLAMDEWLPAFVTETSYSVTREAVLYLAVVAFVTAAVLYAWLYGRKASGFVAFSAAAFACFAVGLGVLVILEPTLGTPINWAGRAAQWMGGLYLFAAVFSLQRGGSSVLALEQSLHEVEDRYQALVNTSPEAILVHSRGKYVFANPAAATLLGTVGSSAILGEDVRRFLHPETAPAELLRIDQAYAGGISPPAETRFLRLDGAPFAAEVSRSQIRWEGRVAVQTVIRDVTERKQAETRLEHDRALLSGIATIFEEALSDRSEGQLGEVCIEVAQAITQSAIGFMGELDRDGTLYDIATNNPGWEACRLLDGHGWGRPLQGLKVHGVYGEVVLTGEPVLTNHPAAHPASIGLPAGHPPLESFLGVPLKKQGETVGMLAVGNRPGGYDAEQRERLDALASVVVQAFDRKRAEEALRRSEEEHRALAEENERLYRQQLDIAETLQLALSSIPSFPGKVRLGHLYRSATEAARVGGDFYDVFEVNDAQIAVLMGDVSGHGIEGARMATLVKDVVNAFTHESVRTHEVLRRTNKLLVDRGRKGFVTLFLGVLDTEAGTLRYTSAGHPEPLLRRASGNVEPLSSKSLPLGVFPEATWKSRQVRIQPDDLLLLYTDGVIEARSDGELFGEDRLTEIVKATQVPVEDVPSLVLREVLAFSSGSLKDDVAMLALSLARVG